MIYATLEQAKSDARWLAYKCPLPHFASARLSNYQYIKLEKELTGVDENLLSNFYDMLFDEYNLKEPIWEKELHHELLPVMALVPEYGVAVILELEANGTYKSDTAKGIVHFEKFHDGTLFTAIKTKPIAAEKISASQMFKSVAWRQKPILVQAAIATVGINLLALGTSFYSMQVYDRVIPTQGISTLLTLSMGVFIAILLEMILKIARSTILDHAAVNMDIAYSHDIFHRFLKIRSDVLPKSIGTLSGQLQSYASVRAFISSAALYALVDFPFSLLFLAVIILISGFQMGLIVLVFLVISIIVGTLFRNKIDILSKTSSMSSHKKLGLLVEAVENAENVKATGSGWSILSRWNALTEEGIYDDIEIRHYSETSTYLAAFFQQLSYIALVGIGAYLASTTDTLTMGGLIAVTILSGRVLSPIAMLPNLFVQWGRAKIAVKDLDNVYALPSDHDAIARPFSPAIIKPTYRCQNIRFSYGKDMPSIKIDNLQIQAGERVAILGAIGSGKSTLLKLLSGLYMPQEGNVLIDGIDMQHISRSRISETIGYLPQSLKLMSGTLRDNLLLGLTGLSDENILDAAKKTGLIHLISSLPQGLDTPVPEGGESVSGGQKQMIFMTRMILFSPNVWLLDEPTASMDDTTEKHIIATLNQAVKSSQTLVIVTHKPALLSLVNRIMVMGPQGILLDGPRDAVLTHLTNSQKKPTAQG